MATLTDLKEDQRLFDRFEAKFPAKLKDTREDFGDMVYLRDASAQGAKLSSKERFYLNDNVALEVDLKDGKYPMLIKGQVVWARNKDRDVWDIGLKFHKISLMHMSRLFESVS